MSPSIARCAIGSFSDTTLATMNNDAATGADVFRIKVAHEGAKCEKKT